MTRFANALALTAALLVPVGSALAQPAAEQAVRDAEAARIRALVANDLDALAAVLHDALSYTHSSGIVDTKASFLDNLRSGRSRYTVFEPSDVKVQMHGETAVVTGRAKVTVLTNGQPSDILLRYTSVYVKQDGTWKFAAWQSTRLPAQ